MKVFKFGGASVKDAHGIQNMASLLASFAGEPLMIVVSAMGKTTNALENVAALFFKGEKDNALAAFENIKNVHFENAHLLLSAKNREDCIIQLKDLLTEVEWLLYDEPVREYAYYYDQIVCVGELLSSTLLHFHLKEKSLPNHWLDVRDVLRTDDSFREAHVDWDFSAAKVQEDVRPDLLGGNWIVTQGFIGSTDENESTTLGREGSDFTAAVFANLLDAESVTIWKDVEGVMNADPKVFPFAQYIAHLNYSEVIEMAYYGAQIIHPKTIKPLQNKQIPLLVKCFLDKDLPGTLIDGNAAHELPPIIILKQNQVALKLKTKDFAFVSGGPLIQLYQHFSTLSIRPNLIQIGAIKVIVCLDDHPEKNATILSGVQHIFQQEEEKNNLNLLTIRHFTPEIIDQLTKDTAPVLIQQTEKTIQVLYQA